jgi:hypothetical protein
VGAATALADAAADLERRGAAKRRRLPGRVQLHNRGIAALKQDIFAARMLHTLLPAGESFRIALKKVLLLNNDEPIDNLTFLV